MFRFFECSCVVVSCVLLILCCVVFSLFSKSWMIVCEKVFGLLGLILKILILVNGFFVKVVLIDFFLFNVVMVLMMVLLIMGLLVNLWVMILKSFILIFLGRRWWVIFFMCVLMMSVDIFIFLYIRIMLGELL